MNNVVQMISGWREVCGSQAKVEGGIVTVGGSVRG